MKPNAADFGKWVMRKICEHAGTALDSVILAECGVPTDRARAVLAGLTHNGYITRELTPDGTVVALTPLGRTWADKRGLTVAAQPPAAKPVAEPIPAAPAPAPAVPAPSVPPPPPQVSAPEPVAAPAPAPSTPMTVAQEPASAPLEPSSAVPAPPATVEKRKRGRPPKNRTPPQKTESGEEGGEIATDTEGFVTHIGGKSIF